MLTLYLGMLETPEEKDLFTQLYQRYTKLMKYVAYQKLGDEQLAEDAVHDAFLNIIKSFLKISDVSCHKTRRLIVIITENAAIDILRKKNRVVQADFEDASYHLSVTPDMLEGIAAQELARQIAALPEHYRVVLELRAYHGLTDKQIAAALNIEHGTVRKRLERARAILAAAIQEQGEEASV